MSRKAQLSRSTVGIVTAIAICGESGAALTLLDEIEAVTGVGLVGDRHAGSAARQISIQSRSELREAADRLGREILAEQTRRNITIDKGSLPRTRGQALRLGAVELEVFSDAAPCALMTELIGEGARPALQRLAGIHCRVIRGGTIHVGDELVLAQSP